MARSPATKKPTKKATRKPAKKPVRRSTAKRSRGGMRLESHHIDLLGLGAVAFGVFLAFVLYFDRAGGRAGEAVEEGLRYLFGGAAYLAPLALVVMGTIIVLREIIPSIKPFRAGAICLLLGLTLGLAAGSLGLGPGAHAHEPLLNSDYISARGGALGELEYQGASALFSDVGAHLLFAFLMVAGILLVTGASLAGIVAGAGRGAVATTARVRRTHEGIATALASSQPRVSSPTPAEDLPPEPPGVEPIVHATHVEAPALDAEERYPDLFPSTATEPPEDAEEPDWAFDPFAQDVDVDVDAGVAEVEDEPEPEPEPQDEPEEEVQGFDRPQRELTPMGKERSGVTEADDFNYVLPKPGFLMRSKVSKSGGKQAVLETERVGKQLIEALGHFGVEAKVVGSVTGPHVTRYELRLAPGIKMSKVSNMRDDLAYALAADDVRILAPIPGKRAVGVEVPNILRQMVNLGDVAQDAPEGFSPLAVWLGKDIDGKAIGIDLAAQPHVLVAGTTGSGKSGAVNAMLASILMRSTPNEVRLVLVDPKQVELNLYEGIPHLLTPVVTNPRIAANVLQNLIREMEERYSLMSKSRTRKLEELNRMRVKEGERPLPYLLCVIDELADLMMVASAEVEDAIIRLAQKSRAVGIHLLLATQRPSADIITGMIKANVPARMAFAVSSQTDSRVILDSNGAESLLGKGDMLFKPGNGSKLNRIQGAFIGEEEIEKLTAHWRRQGEPELHEELLDPVEPAEAEEEDKGDFDPDQDDLLPEAIRTVIQMDTASTSMLQRRLRVGYTRAGRLIDMLERRGVISGYEGSKARKVLITEADLPRILDALADGISPEPEPVGDQA